MHGEKGEYMDCNFQITWMNHVDDDHCDKIPGKYCGLKSETRPMQCDEKKCILLRILNDNHSLHRSVDY